MTSTLNPTARAEIQTEFSALIHSQHTPLGCYVMPSPTNPFQWTCHLFIHRGYYASSVVTFHLNIPQSYPSTELPTLQFLTPNVFHPLIDPINGKMTLESRWPNGWRPRVDFLFNVLHWVKGVFKRKCLDSVLEGQARNKEAWRLYREQTALFTKLASQSALLSITEAELYGPNKRGGIPFKKLTEGEQSDLWETVEEEGRKRIVVNV